MCWRERVIRIMVGTCRVALPTLGSTFFLGIDVIAANVLARPELLAEAVDAQVSGPDSQSGPDFHGDGDWTGLFKVFCDSGSSG
jgi:hypothetical protein